MYEFTDSQLVKCFALFGSFSELFHGSVQYPVLYLSLTYEAAS